VADLAAYRVESERLRSELAVTEANRRQLLRAIRANEALIATAIAPEQPLLPIEGLQRTASRSTTRHGRALSAKLNKTDRKVLRIVAGGPISFADLRERSGVNEWTLRDSIARLMVAGEVRRFGLARATRFVKASLKSAPDTSLHGFLASNS
jgi:predicted HTH transcriptional regulator